MFCSSELQARAKNSRKPGIFSCPEQLNKWCYLEIKDIDKDKDILTLSDEVLNFEDYIQWENIYL